MPRKSAKRQPRKGSDTAPAAASGPALDPPLSPAARFRRWLRSFLPFAIILIFDPFGCSQVADRNSEQILLRIAAPFYNGGAGAATLGQAKVAVVLIDQPWVKSESLEPLPVWPLPRSAQLSLILGGILAQGPEAVLLDYTFSGERLGAAPTGAAAGFDTEAPDAIREQVKTELAAAALPPSGVPPRLFLGSKPLLPSTARGCAVPRVPALDLAQADDVASTLRHWDDTGGPGGIEVVTLRRYDASHYPLLTYQVGGTAERCGEVPNDGAAGYLASPAYALFVSWCERDRQRAGGNALCATARRRPAPLDAVPDHIAPTASYYLYAGAPALAGSLAPVWPGFRSPGLRAIQDTLYPQPADGIEGRPPLCETSNRGPIAASFKLAVRLFWTRLRRSDQGGGLGVEPCRYGVDVITMTELKALVGRGQQPLRGRYVIVGLDVDNVHDVVESPLYGPVPGALIHAVAFENLISLGDGFLSDAPAGLPVSGTLITFIIGWLLSLPAASERVETGIAALVGYARREHWGWLAKLWAIGLVAAALLGMVAIPLGLGALLTRWAALAPVNWVSIVPAMLWLLEITFDKNETLLAAAETARDRAGAGWSNPWLRQFWLPVIVVTGVGAALILVLQ